MPWRVNLLIGPFLRLVGEVPVHRRQEWGADPVRNRAMSSAASASGRARWS